MSSPNYLDISLLGKEYRVACPPEEHDALLTAVGYVDAKMRDIADRTKSSIPERSAVMAALNIAHELLSRDNERPEQPTSGSETALDIDETLRRISDMEAQLDTALAPAQKLY